MIVERIGQAAHLPDGRIYLQDWDFGEDYRELSNEEMEELLEIAKENGTYRGIKTNAGSL